GSQDNSDGRMTHGGAPVLRGRGVSDQLSVRAWSDFRPLARKPRARTGGEGAGASHGCAPAHPGTEDRYPPGGRPGTIKHSWGEDPLMLPSSCWELSKAEPVQRRKSRAVWPPDTANRARTSRPTEARESWTISGLLVQAGAVCWDWNAAPS